MNQVTTRGSILGNSVQRKEDPALIKGSARYVDDLAISDVAHLVFVRSTVAHARLSSVDVSEASSMPGVIAIYTAANIGLAPYAPMLPQFLRAPIADGRVLFVGEPVAVVVAATRAQGVDAAEAVQVDYEQLDPIVDAEAAATPASIKLWGEGDAASNVGFGYHYDSVPDVFEGADVVVNGRFVNQRLAAVPMETNAILVQPDGDGFIMNVSTQGPHGVRDGLAKNSGIEPEKLRVIAPAVGGGFGAKMGMYAEYLVALQVCKLLGRPVKWAETRSENMVSMVHGRGQVQNVELGLKRDGTIVGLRVEITQDAGAYPAIGAFLPMLTRQMAQGVYQIPKIQVGFDSMATNTTPTGAYRGAGRPEAAAMLERIMDLAALELKMDPAELRRKNFIPKESFPLTTVTGANYDVGDYAKALDEALRVSDYPALRAEQAKRRAANDVKLLGIGVSAYVEVTAGGMFQEFGACEVDTNGKVTLRVGTSPHGQGHETSFAMIVSDVLGIPMEDITLAPSDTAIVPRGQGTGASRSLQIGGSALLKASEGVLDKAKQIAAHLLEASADDMVAVDGKVGVVGVPAKALTWIELAKAAADPAKLPAGMDPGLAVELDFNQGEASYPFGAHVAVVEVDRDTGKVELIRHVAVDDCGRRLNPMLVTGQQHGGIAQGVAQALFEEFIYDEDGNPLTGNLMDYSMPSAAEFPSFEAINTETPTPLNPLGAKGIGESGTIGSTPAVQSAVIDALSHLGVTHLDMPATPQRVWNALQSVG